jgi:hypothetical protein
MTPVEVSRITPLDRRSKPDTSVSKGLQIERKGASKDRIAAIM